jgi:hypothetical protein
MFKYVLVPLAALTLAGCSTTEPQRSAAAGGSAPGREVVRVQLDNGEVRELATDYNLQAGDRVELLTNGKVAPVAAVR